MSQRDVVRVAKLKGLTLQARVVKRVVKVVAEDETESDDRDKVAFILDGVKRYIDANPGTSRIVDDATIETVIAELSKDEEEMDQNRMQVWRSFASCAAARRHLHPPTLPQHALTPHCRAASECVRYTEAAVRPRTQAVCHVSTPRPTRSCRLRLTSQSAARPRCRRLPQFRAHHPLLAHAHAA